MKLEEKLSALRKEKGLTQLQLAEQMNVSRQAVSRWETGDAIPSTDNLKYLGSLYEVPLDYLLHDDAPEPVRTVPEPVQEAAPPVKDGNKNRKLLILPVLIAVGIVAAALCVVLFGNKEKAPVPIEELEGSDPGIVYEFKFDW